tara:strand:+ start:2800 stop:2937 length:138 start_codon:yes stop_codon:yes gene_type:complete
LAGLLNKSRDEVRDMLKSNDVIELDLNERNKKIASSRESEFIKIY